MRIALMLAAGMAIAAGAAQAQVTRSTPGQAEARVD